MGARLSFSVSNTLVSTILGSGETVNLTTPPLIPPYDGAPVLIIAYVDFSTGSAVVSSVTGKIVRGNTTGLTALGGSAVLTEVTVAGTRYARTFAALDTAIGLSGQVYSYTMSTNTTGGAGTINNGTIVAMCL